jgi:hypothetical protein
MFGSRFPADMAFPAEIRPGAQVLRLLRPPEHSPGQGMQLLRAFLWYVSGGLVCKMEKTCYALKSPLVGGGDYDYTRA